MQRGRPPKPIEQHIADRTYRPDRHGPKPPTLDHLPPERRPIELTQAQQADRAAEMERQRRAIGPAVDHQPARHR
jgi:hypothetical protein